MEIYLIAEKFNPENYTKNKSHDDNKMTAKNKIHSKLNQN